MLRNTCISLKCSSLVPGRYNIPTRLCAPSPFSQGRWQRGISSFPSLLTPPVVGGAAAHRHTQQSKGAQVLPCVLCWVWIPVSYISNCPPWAPARRNWALSGMGVLRKHLLRAQPGVDCCSGTSWSSGSVLCLTSSVNFLGTGSLTKEDPKRIRDTSAVAQVAQWAETVLK